MSRKLRVAVLASSLFGAGGCLGSMATGAMADALSETGGVYATDDDPELIGEAVPFGLKTMESILVEQPEHRGLLTALASGFTQYAYVYVLLPAEDLADRDIDRSMAMKVRARKLLLRARDYAIRGLEVEHEGISEKVRAGQKEALAIAEAEDAALLYWAAASWGLAVSAAKGDAAALADLPQVEALARRALEVDEGWNQGAIHEFFITYESVNPNGSLKKARDHFARAVELSGGKRAGPYVALAESVSIKEQNAKEFHALLAKALAIDVDKFPEERLANVVMQRRAKRLKAASGDLFLDDVQGDAGSSKEKQSS